MKTAKVIVLVGVAFPFCFGFGQSLSFTSVGRFGAGKEVTENTATQDLLVWNVRNAGKSIELRFYGPKGDLASFGFCGFSTGVSSVGNKVHSIGWTQLWSTYESGNEKIDVLETLLTPVLWFRTSGASIRFFQSEVSEPTGPKVVNIYQSNEPWALATVQSKGLKVPVVILYHSKPSRIALSDHGLELKWIKPNQLVGIVPVYGCNPKPPLDLTMAKTRAREIAKRLLAVPVGLQETYSLINRRQVRITNTVRFLNSKDDWGWSKPFCPVPSAVHLAATNGYPVWFKQSTIDSKMNGYLSAFSYVAGTQLQYTLAVPDLYSTIASPYQAPFFIKLLPQPVEKTVKNYSEFIVNTYDKRDRKAIFDNSALGEARMLASEYPNYRMMSRKAQKVFSTWADWASRACIYNRQRNYGYGEEAANKRRLLIDNYRFAGHDYMDAGWFGYSIVAMWSRAHFGNRWLEVKANWPLIKELFYGWNWSYTDYHACNAPLYLDAEKGGNPKGYTDSMGMLGACYAWARMADRMKDSSMFRDSLYLLAKERVGRFARMMAYEWSAQCGYETEVYYLTSDMGNGPNIALTSRYKPDHSIRFDQDVVDYGPANDGLWYISGSFLEPITPETIDLMNIGTAKKKVRSTLALMDQRYKRWWASPAAGEVANYQIYLRGALYHEDPNWLRYVYDYQDLFGKGIWLAESWHANAFAGIVMSAMRGLEEQDYWKVRHEGQDLIERNLWCFSGNRKGFTLDSHATKPRRVAVLFTNKLKDYRLPIYIDAKTGKRIRLSGFTVNPGLNVFIDSCVPESVLPVSSTGYAGQKTTIEARFFNKDRRRKTFTIGLHSDSHPVAVSLRPKETTSVSLPASAAKSASLQTSVFVTVNGQRHTVRIHTLPACVAWVELNANKVSDQTNLGVAHVMIANPLLRTKRAVFQWGFDQTTLHKETIEVPGGTTFRNSFQLQTNDIPTGKHTLFAEIEGMARQSAKQVVMGNTANPILLYDFSDGAEDWSMPDWPDANKSPQGQLLACSAIDGTLNIPLSFNKRAKTEGFVNCAPTANWQRFRSVSAEIYVPANAPRGLRGSFFLMGDGWKWNVPLETLLLEPGQWNRIEAPLNDEGLESYWNVSYGQFVDGLRQVIGFGIRITKPDGIEAYQGVFRLDNVIVFPR